MGAALGVVAAVLLTPRSAPIALWVLGGIALGLLLLAAAARVSWRWLGLRLIILEPAALGVAVLSLFQPHGGAIFLWLLARSSLCLLAMLLLSATTPVSQMLAILRTLRVPALLVTTLALMHRYLHVLLEESLRMRRARASRTFTTGRRRAWYLSASVAGQLFLRSSARSERIYTAMGARGWR
jgi:cobalt/nickel transport system permease protein